LKGSSQESKHLVKGGRSPSLIDLHFPKWDYYFLKTKKEKNKRAINEYMPRESCGDDGVDDF
jgi:hypothetical protein